MNNQDDTLYIINWEGVEQLLGSAIRPKLVDLFTMNTWKETDILLLKKHDVAVFIGLQTPMCQT